MGSVVKLAFDGKSQLEQLDASVRILSARIKLAATPVGAIASGSGLSSPELAEHLRRSAGSLRHLADQLTLAAISIEVGSGA